MSSPRAWLDRLSPALFAAVLTLAGAVATIAAAAAIGMPGDELGGLAISLLPALVVSVAAAAAATKLLIGSSIRRRTLGTAALASLLALLNMLVLAAFMYLDGSQVGKLAVLVLYSGAAGGAAALAVTRSTTATIDELTAVARRMGDGDLEVRSGAAVRDPELAELAWTLDDMATRLQASIERERDLESHRIDMITAASHDLRTPLASLRAMIEALEDGVVPEGPERTRYLREMGVSVDSLTGLTDDLFDLIKLEATEIEADTETASLAEIVASALALTEIGSSEKGVTVSTELGAAAPVLCSPRLVRVVGNLVQNAIRHTPPGGRVVVIGEPRDAGVTLVVEDDGEGISIESREKVFEPFWRGDSARTSKGSGLGLTLVKRIVERLGGEIMVSAGAAGGARFSVSVPAAGSGLA